MNAARSSSSRASVRARALVIALAAGAVAAAAAGSVTGCAGDETVKPVPTGTTPPPPPPDAGSTASGPDAGDAGPIVREVFTRNPFGDATGNLLVDGDFEFSILPEGSAGQNGWIGFSSNGAEAPILGETGGLCKSGLRCGRVKKGMILFGRGTAAPGEKRHRVTIWVKPIAPDAEAPCKVLRPRLVACDSFDSLGSVLPPQQPDESGWCKFEDDADASKIAACLYVDVLADTLIDAASVVAADDAAGPPPPIHFTDTAEDRAKMQYMRDVIHRRIRFGKMPELPDAPAPIPY